jgi:hypothetical protein
MSNHSRGWRGTPDEARRDSGLSKYHGYFAPFFYAGCKGTEYSSKEVIGYGQKNSNVYHLNGIHYGVGAERMQKNRRND